MYTSPPDGQGEPEHVARYLEQPIAAVWNALDRGRAVADEFFLDPRRDRDSHLWAHLARYEAVLSLKELPVSDEWGFRFPHHSGIEIVMGAFRVRVCKAIFGGPQSPGRNRARRHFFQQLSMSQLTLPFIGSAPSTNLLLYWHAPGEDLELGLCKPKGHWQFKGTPRLEWRRPITLDPFAGLTFPATEDDDLYVFRLADEELGEEETGE